MYPKFQNLGQSGNISQIHDKYEKIEIFFLKIFEKIFQIFFHETFSKNFFNTC
jgi:hypothetical protein